MLDFEYIQIEPTFNCNLQCKHCGRGRRYVGEEMTPEGLQLILDQFKDFRINYVVFNGGGEVFTHNKIEDMFTILNKKGYPISIISNGTLLHKKDMEYIIQNGLLYFLILSMEGATKNSYESVRGENTFDLFISNIKRIQELKDRWKTPFPRLMLNVVCMKDNLQELPLIVDFARENGIREIMFVHLNPNMVYSPRIINEKLCASEHHLSNCDPDEVKKIFQTIKEKTSDGFFYSVQIPRIEFNGLAMKKKDVVKKPYCPWLAKRTFINWEGYVIPCCQVGRHLINFGNVFEENFIDIWNSTEYTEFREGFFNGNPHFTCKNCNEYNGVGFG